ncbi:MAG: chromosome segregation protein [Patescibacteria group bacterium]|nr:chromosome segregation protein [Patescibacteria group bacterium]
MFLQKIILKNFKSFKGKVVIDLPSLITAIVGPNGSGKSNIVDAIRWALGEQSFKNLRVEKGEDLIFAGNKKETAASLCEVELIFDNQLHLFNSDYNEISILRRIERSGENSYFLNHKPCRLKDIIDLTASAKIGLKGFSIINQGAVESLLLVSPLERRIMLEEILGLKNLELKKEEAERKLEETNINLDKSLALEKEILPHLRSLKRQVSRWERREEIEGELKLKERQYFTYLWKSLVRDNLPQTEKLAELKERIEKLTQNIQKEESKLVTLKENENADLENKIQKITQEIIELQNQKSELLRELGRQEVSSKITITEADLAQEISNLKKKLEELLKIEEIETIHQQIKDLLISLDSCLKPPSPKEKPAILKLQEQLSQLEEKIALKGASLKQFQTELTQKNQNFRSNFEQINNLRLERENLLKEEQREELLLEKYKLRLEDFERRLKEADLTLEEIKAEAAQPTPLASEGDLISLEKQIFRLKKEIAEIGTEDLNVKKEYEEVTQRYEFLTQQREDLEKSSRDLKILIQQLTKEIESTFEKSLSEINEDFNKYFRLMFQGGFARLEQIKKSRAEQTLENNSQNEILAAVPEENYWGVDIKIDIPKTDLKSLEMLSGGEKTLVAISLLLAIVTQSEPPLVILDEIDAALDEDNSQRFSKILTELGKNTQFIIITHNRSTMAAAQIIYGVTIGPDNSSQLLSIKLEDSFSLLQGEKR